MVVLMKVRDKRIHILNERPNVQGAAIYTANHSTKYDVPITAEVIGQHAVLLAGTQSMKPVDRLGFIMNGTIWCDRKDKTSRLKSKQYIVNLLKMGHNIMMYPEGTWNLTPSKPMLPLYWGCIDIAKEAHCPIVPLVLEYKGDDVYVKFGTPLTVEAEDDKLKKINELTDVLATLKWEIWESFPTEHRTDFYGNEWEEEKQKRIAEYPKLDYEYEKSCVRQ
jgi:1-acyl-sn-glycerol-3-phosphate acyltransferase